MQLGRGPFPSRFLKKRIISRNSEKYHNWIVQNFISLLDMNVLEIAHVERLVTGPLAHHKREKQHLYTILQF
jgi:hypothetical protein